jgi:predicted acetyltransferase
VRQKVESEERNIVLDILKTTGVVKLQGGLEFSEVTSTKWIFDVEIEKLRAKFRIRIFESRH